MLLAVDSATDSLGLAITDGNRLLAEEVWLTPRHATVELAPEAARLLRRSGVENESLTGLAVTIGPGSYTGLRIGLAFAKGMAFGRGIKIVGIPTFDVLAGGQASRSEPLLALAHAGRGRWSAAWYNWSKKSWTADGDSRLVDFDSLAGLIDRPTFVCGEMTNEERHAIGALRHVRLADPAQCVRRPGILAVLGWEALRRKKADDLFRIVPNYPLGVEG